MTLPLAPSPFFNTRNTTTITTTMIIIMITITIPTIAPVNKEVDKGSGQQITKTMLIIHSYKHSYKYHTYTVCGKIENLRITYRQL